MAATFPASSNGGGQCFAMPDVCLTPAPPAPPIPIPYPNIAMLPQATKTSLKVRIVQKQAATEKTEIPSSSGDEAGTNKGTMSGMNMGKMVFKKGSSKVMVEGAPLVHLTSMSAHNGSNANAPAGNQVAPSQSKVLVSP